MTVQHTHWFDVVSADCPACATEIVLPEPRHECEICLRPSIGVWCRFHEENDGAKSEVVYGARGAVT